ncbi:MAG TPA: hypothetical protein VNY36_08215 [Bacteroidia bacterium]|jgi:hypothetical protein|nr:hypothetical protein [Bacteroidia bacterium]
MKKLILAFLTFSFSFFYATAQVDTGKKVTGFLTLGYGLCQSVSDFGSTANNTTSGYAQVGTANNLSFGIIINSINFGFSFMRNTSSNIYNTSAYTSNLQASQPSATFTAVSNKQPYLGGYIFYGIYKAFYVKRFTFDVRIMAGPCSIILPYVSYGEVLEGLQSSEYINGGATSATAFCGNLGIRYSITEGFCASIEVSYVYAQTSFTTTENYADNNGNAQVYQYVWNLPVSLLNVSLNVGWQFGRFIK